MTARRLRTLGPGWIFSPGVGLPVWLGPAELRVWRELEPHLTRRRRPIRTVLRAIARDLGLNPGSVSRILSRLHGLRLLVHETSRGRLGGVTLWRTVGRVSGAVLAPARRIRALARVGVELAGAVQLELNLGELVASMPGSRRSP